VLRSSSGPEKGKLTVGTGWGVTGNAVHTGKKRNAYRVLLGKPESKKPLGRPRHRWGNTKMNLEETEWEGVFWLRIRTSGDHL